MPDVTISIGGRKFDVACQPGEEDFLHGAAGMLDREAQVLVGQTGRLTEAKMLLMAGLMLADRTVGSESQIDAMQQEIEDLKGQIQALQDTPPQEIRVPFIPDSVTQSMAELAARAEAMAQRLEDNVGAE
ncbi:cell division protein ZapA [Pseudooceanicola algae]|uniref:Cell division protein ZapA n=1 Tax=Pseudooceanicola algae TaxID=1537215 RepID=A0A418SFK2_9RHOB|nr:cell division protein ZapA [Pseudooceanicola algae]QPM89867.1 hypothetical protein PSAL_010960 [Pseudooceanicola algae]